MDIISPVDVPDREASVSGLYKVGAAADAYLARRAAGTSSPAESTVRFIPHSPETLALRRARLNGRQPDGPAPRVYTLRRAPQHPPTPTPSPVAPAAAAPAEAQGTQRATSAEADRKRSKVRRPAPQPKSPNRPPRLRSDCSNLDAVILHWLRRNHIVP